MVRLPNPSNIESLEGHHRSAALRRLVQQGRPVSDDVIPTLMRIFRTEQRGVNRLSALQVLMFAWPDERVMDAFRMALASRSFLVSEAVSLLSKDGSEVAFELLSEAFLESDDPALRIAVLKVFHNAPHMSVLSLLRSSDVLRTTNDEVRATAVVMVGRIANPTVVRVLIPFLSDTNDRVRANTVEALGRVLSPQAMARVLSPCLKDRNNRVRGNTILALSLKGFGCVCRELRRMATHANVLFRATAAWVLGRIPDFSGRVDLLQSLRDDRDSMVCRQAAKSLELVGAY